MCRFDFTKSLPKIETISSQLCAKTKFMSFLRIQNLLWIRTALLHEIHSTNLKYLSSQDFYLIPLNLIPKWHISSQKKTIISIALLWFSICTAKFPRCWQKEAFECCLAVVINTLVALHLLIARLASALFALTVTMTTLHTAPKLSPIPLQSP